MQHVRADVGQYEPLLGLCNLFHEKITVVPSLICTETERPNPHTIYVDDSVPTVAIFDANMRGCWIKVRNDKLGVIRSPLNVVAKVVRKTKLGGTSTSPNTTVVAWAPGLWARMSGRTDAWTINKSS